MVHNLDTLIYLRFTNEISVAMHGPLLTQHYEAFLPFISEHKQRATITWKVLNITPEMREVLSCMVPQLLGNFTKDAFKIRLNFLGGDFPNIYDYMSKFSILNRSFVFYTTFLQAMTAYIHRIIYYYDHPIAVFVFL